MYLIFGGVYLIFGGFYLVFWGVDLILGCVFFIFGDFHLVFGGVYLVFETMYFEGANWEGGCVFGNWLCVSSVRGCVFGIGGRVFGAFIFCIWWYVFGIVENHESNRFMSVEIMNNNSNQSFLLCASYKALR